MAAKQSTDTVLTSDCMLQGPHAMRYDSCSNGTGTDTCLAVLAIPLTITWRITMYLMLIISQKLQLTLLCHK